MPSWVDAPEQRPLRMTGGANVASSPSLIVAQAAVRTMSAQSTSGRHTAIGVQVDGRYNHGSPTRVELILTVEQARELGVLLEQAVRAAGG